MSVFLKEKINGGERNSYIKVIAKSSKRSESAALSTVRNVITMLRGLLQPLCLRSPWTMPQQRGFWYNVQRSCGFSSRAMHHALWDTAARASQQAPHLQWELLGNLRDVGGSGLLLVQRHHNKVLEQLPLLILDQVPFQGLVPRGLLQARFHVDQALAVSYKEKD